MTTGTTRSRNVKRYVRAVFRARELTAQLEDALRARIVAERALNGGQWAEARRILADQALVDALCGVAIRRPRRPKAAG
ncbi:MAG: hypothetical protein ACRENJ_03850 [Candidatus Eiseniibacteriota bacterium]